MSDAVENIYTRRIRELERQRDEFAEAFRAFGRHLDHCGDADAYNNASTPTCGCGLDALRAQLLVDDDTREGGACNVCGRGVRYGERHYTCGAAVMGLEKTRNELAEVLREYMCAIRYADSKNALMSAIKTADDKAGALLARLYAESEASNAV